MKKQLSIVDDYNMIGAWSELVQLRKQEYLEGARELLLSHLSNYAKYRGLEVIVVFDTQLVPGIRRTYKKYLLTVVLIKEDETADSYIERPAGERNDRLTQVTIAANDLVEQWMVFPRGTSRTSANELYRTVQKTEETTAIRATDIHSQRFRRNPPWNVEQPSKPSEKLEELSQRKS